MEDAVNGMVRDLRRKKRGAQERMLQLYGERIFCHVARIVPCREDAEEVYCDVFLKAFRSIESFDGGQASLFTWLSRIAYHESLNFVRRGKPPIVYVNDNEVDLERLQDDTLAEVMQQHDEETTRRLDKALDLLPPHERALILMFYYDQLSIKDIATVTDSLPSTVGSQLSRIRRKLCRIIKTLA